MDQYEQLLIKLYISNSLLLAELQFQRAKKPKAAKLCQLVNGDFLMNFDRYMEEIEGAKKEAVVAGVAPDEFDVDEFRSCVESGDLAHAETLLLNHRSYLETNLLK